MSQTGTLIDEVLAAMMDQKWHDISEIAVLTTVDKRDLKAVLRFMEHFGLINRKDERIRINKTVSRCLSFNE